jgi:hypothetical protein
MSPQMWLIVAELNDSLAREVIRILRANGERAVLIDSPDVMSRYVQESIPCILILPPNKTILPDALTTALTIGFAAHILIIPDKDTPTPDKPWINAIISGTQSPEDIVAQLRNTWDNLAIRTDKEKQARIQEYGLEHSLSPILSKDERQEHRREQWRKGLIIAQIAMLSLVVASSIYSIVTRPHYHYHYTPPPTFSADQIYQAQVPGPCTGTQGSWYGYQKDSYECHSDGLLMTRIDHAYTYDMNLSLYTGTSEGYYRSSYAVQVIGSITKPDIYTCMGLAVHESKAGKQIFYACNDGIWSINQYGTDGKFSKYLGNGVLPKRQNTYTLRVDVHGSTMSFWIDNNAIDTVDDPTYTTTAEVGLVLCGSSDSSQNEESLFSDFSVTPYGDAKPGDTQIQALAAAQKTIITPYQAHTPGDGCDHGNGGWSHSDYENDPSLVSFTCQSNGFKMISPKDGTIALEDYFNRLGVFPGSYRVATTITLGSTGNVCAGISTNLRLSLRRVFVICDDGFWRIYHLGTDGKSVTDDSGTVPQAATYHLVVTIQSEFEALSINGKPLSAPFPPVSLSDDTTMISLADYCYDDTHPAGYATFSDFNFTPLS